MVQDGAESAEAVRAMRELATDPDIAFVIAHVPASVLLTVIPVYEENKVPLLIPANSHQGLIDHQWTFPLIPSDYDEGAAAAAIAAGWGAIGPLGVIHDPGPYGILLSSAFKEKAGKAGLPVKAVPCSAADTLVNSIVADLLKTGPSMIWLAGPPGWGSEILAAVVGAGYTGKILAPQTYGRVALDDLFGVYADRLGILWPWGRQGTDDGVAATFRTNFLQSFLQEPEWTALIGYDAVRCLGKVLESGPVTRSQIRDHLRGYNSSDHAWRGLSGAFYFDGRGHVQRSFRIVTWSHGRLEAMP
jgi:branched-chain amino acid transport system substrate-binding protein